MFHEIFRDRKGAIAIISAFMLVAVIGISALAVEFGRGLYRRAQNQRIADIAAFSGALVYAATGSSSSATSAVGNIVQLNGLPSSAAIPSVNPNNQTVSVTVTTSDPLLLARVLTSMTSLSVSATATAQVNGGSGCVLALNPAASGAITMNGNVNIDADCGIDINSSSSSALLMNGNNSITATSANIVGNILRNPTSGNTLSIPKIQTGAAATSDPYANVQVPSFSGCTYPGGKTINGSGNFTLNPGVYCGSIIINGNPTVTLTPGTYILDQGFFIINGGGTVTGNGVAIVLTSSTGSGIGSFTNTGNPVLNLTAETSSFSGPDPMPGFVVFQDRRAPVGGSNTFNGAAGSTLAGALYFPTQNLIYNGNPTVGPGCTELVAQTITFNGNPSLYNDTCNTQFGLSPIGSSGVKLVG